MNGRKAREKLSSRSRRSVDGADNSIPPGCPAHAATIDAVLVATRPTSAAGTYVLQLTADDAEERSASASLSATDLELVDGTAQTVGLRFAGVAPTALPIAGQAADDPAPFAAVPEDVSSRPRTAATVSWVPVPWLARWAVELRGAHPNSPGSSRRSWTAPAGRKATPSSCTSRGAGAGHRLRVPTSD
jgi:hypothetical protein